MAIGFVSFAAVAVVLEWRAKERTDEVAAALDDRLHTQEYVEGYVDGLQRRVPGEPQRRLRRVR